MRIVADANIVLSALLWGGTPRALLDAARHGRIMLYTSAALMAELEDVLSRPKLAKRLTATGNHPGNLLDGYLALARFIIAPPLPEPVSRDPDDDHVLACALAANADAIATGDTDLLVLQPEWHGITILTARQALDRLGS